MHFLQIAVGDRYFYQKFTMKNPRYPKLGNLKPSMNEWVTPNDQLPEWFLG